VTTESGVLNRTQYSSGTPFKNRTGTNPAELIAAAHAGSFAIALANELGSAGFVPDRIATTATVTLEHQSAGWTMTNINLEVLASVPKAAQCDFIDAALRAKTGCPVSRLLHTNISLNAKLDTGLARDHPARTPG
jgi:osmotically inducible protein OsmC